METELTCLLPSPKGGLHLPTSLTLGLANEV